MVQVVQFTTWIRFECLLLGRTTRLAGKKYLMSPDDMLAIVRAIYFGPTQDEIVTPLLEKLIEALPHSNITDLIF
jgi:hypothetical protein